MRITIKIVLTIVLIGALIFCAAFIFFSIRGKDLVTEQLRKVTQREVNIGYFALHLPSEIALGNVDISGLAKARSVIIRPNIFKCLFGCLVFDKIALQGLEYTFVLAKPASVVNSPVSESIFQLAEDVRQKMSFGRSIFIKNLDSSLGTLDFIDEGARNKGIEFRLEELSLVLHNLTYLSHAMVSNFDLKARIPWHEGLDKGGLEAKGWFDLSRKDMEATVKITDIDGIYLYPYYSGWIDLEKARIQKAKLDFNSSVRSEDNNLVALCHLELKDILFKPRSPREELRREERIVNTVVGAFKSLDQGKIAIDFVVRTSMDQPKFGLANIKSAVEDKMMQARQANRLTVQKAALLPGKVVGGTVKGTTDITRALIGGTLSLGKELKKAFEVAFTREK
ncbi:MAG: DUF748 domain-containing protein [Candidatus Omnitrophica bacterium]|nr:DUF748 domain-containing protein [Candidatus Omnitrophota bacterium]